MFILSQESDMVIDGEPFNIKRDYPFRIATLNDMHCGSALGLCPEKWRSRTGNETFPNEAQMKLREYFIDYCDKANEFKPNMLWVPGDITMGQNRIERGAGVIDVDLDKQKHLAADVVKEFCERVPTIKDVLIWYGTPYHGSMDMDLEEAFSDRLNVMGVRSQIKGEYSYIYLRYNGLVKSIWITHTAPESSMYPEQVMGKDMMTWQEAEAQGKVKHVDMIIRAHKHTFVEVHKTSIRSLQLPAWQLLPPYQQALQNWAKWQPDIGGVVLLFDDKLRSNVLHFTYPNYIPKDRILNISSDYKGVLNTCLSKS